MRPQRVLHLDAQILCKHSGEDSGDGLLHEDRGGVQQSAALREAGSATRPEALPLELGSLPLGVVPVPMRAAAGHVVAAIVAMVRRRNI
jgi:hypothetical protein